MAYSEFIADATDVTRGTTSRSPQVRRLGVYTTLLYLCLLSVAAPCESVFAQSTAAERATAQLLINQINAAISAGASSVTIAPGEYRIGSNSNTILPISNAHNLTIIADGVNLIATDLKQVLGFSNSNNVTFRGATIDYDPLPFTQGTVTSVSSSTFDVTIHDGYKAVTGNQRVILYDPATRRVKDDTITRYGTSVTSTGPSTLRMSRQTTADALAVGDLVSVTGSTLIPHGIFLSNSNNLPMQDVTLHASTSFGFFESGGGGNTYQNIQVVPGPAPVGATEPRLLSSNADAFHSKHTSVGPKIYDSHFANHGDDGIAINTDFHLVGSSVGIQLQIGAKTSFDQLKFFVGDRIQGFSRATGEVTEAVVLSITRDASLDAGLTQIRNTQLPTANNLLNIGYRLTLDKPLNLSQGDLVSSPDRNGNGFEIVNSTVENHRARGILVKASDGLIENNLVDGSTIGGIVLAAEPFYWQEGSFAENVVIRGNTVLNTSRQYGQAGQSQVAGIAITSDYGWAGQNHANILIENNLVANGAGPGLIVSLVDGVQVNNNRFVNTHGVSTINGVNVGVDPTTTIWVDRASNISFAGNTIRNAGPYFNSMLRTGDATVGVSGAGTGIRIVHDAASVSVANYRDDFQTSSPASGWKYLWNAGGEIGDANNYQALVSTGGDYTSDGTPTPTAGPARYARLGAENGHPGLGSMQSGSQGTDRFVIASYIIPRDGSYALRDSFVRTENNGSYVDVVVHVGNDSPLLSGTVLDGATASFDVDLGSLTEGEVVYIAFGPDSVDVSDFFSFDFSIDLLIVPGDYNQNGLVEAADYTLWRDEYGSTGAGLRADGTGPDGAPDGVVDTYDYDLWAANFGKTSSDIGASEAVPEPEGFVQVLIAAYVTLGLGFHLNRREARLAPVATPAGRRLRSTARNQAVVLIALFWCSVLAPVSHAEQPIDRAGAPFDLQAYIDKSIAAGETEVVVPPGRYRVEPSEGVHLRLHDLEGVTILADGVEMICTETTRALSIENCRGLTLRGLAIDYDPLPFTQGRIVTLSADKRVHEVELFPGYPSANTAYNFKYQIFRPDGSKLRSVDYYDLEIEALSETRLRITKTSNDTQPLEEKGDLVVIGCKSSPDGELPHAVLSRRCMNLALEEVDVLASNCFAFLEVECSGTRYKGCRVKKQDPQSDSVQGRVPRLRSANADAFHSKFASSGPRIIECYAHHHGDDCVNICGDYHLVTSSEGAKLRVLAKHAMDIDEGDFVELATFDGGALPDAKVMTIRPLGGANDRERSFVRHANLQRSFKEQERGALTEAYELTLDRDVSLSLGSMIASRRRQGRGFTVADCDFGDTRSRGILIKASDGEVRGNRLSNCRMESIKVAPEFFWLESGAASNLQITDNFVEDCGDIAIAVYARGFDDYFSPCGAHRHISITRNRVVSSPWPNILVTSTNDLVVTDNECGRGRVPTQSENDVLAQLEAEAPGASAAVLTHKCLNVTIQNND